MRFTTVFIFLVAAMVSAPGCKTPTNQCQRETALLRAEILDLEDKYYALKSEYESAVGGTPSPVVTSNVIGSGVIQSDVIYEDQVVPGSSPVIYESQTVPTQSPALTPGVQSTLPTVPAEPGTIDTGSSSINHSNSPGPVMLPDAREFEVGFEDPALNATSNEPVDRIEIVSSGTRGKDLDGIRGDDGVEVMIKAVNPNGQPVKRTGELTVTVRDPLAGEIGKWTFLPEELELFLSRDEFGNVGTLLHLPWTDRIPVSKQVEIRVSMMIDQVQYIATRNLKIEPPTSPAGDSSIVGWATEDDRWISDSKPTFKNVSTVMPSTSSSASERPQWKPVR